LKRRACGVIGWYAAAIGVAVAVTIVPVVCAVSTRGQGVIRPVVGFVPSTTPPADEAKRVLFVTEPLGARVFRDGVDLGFAPLTIDVAPGQVAKLEIRREGYKSEIKTLDGSQPKVLVKLDKTEGPRPRGSAAPPESPAAGPVPIGGGEIVNPWAK
jgi:hypothetical protein